MSRFIDTITFRRSGVQSTFRCVSGLAFGLGMIPSLFAACGCQDGIDISVSGYIYKFEVAGVGQGPAKEINVIMKKGSEYDFTLSAELDPEISGISCPFGTVNLECGLEYQYKKTDGTVTEFTPGRTIAVAGWNGALEPNSFRLKISEEETETCEDKESENSDKPSSSVGADVPAIETEPKVDLSGSAIPPGLSIDFPLQLIGTGSNSSDPPFRSAGYLSCGGTLTAGLAQPVNFTYEASEEIKGRPSATIWGPALNPRVSYSSPSGYAQERHIKTPTRLFRVTGFDLAPDAVVDFGSAHNTYVREYLRGSSGESVSVTLATSPVSWWTVKAVSNGVKVTQSVRGIEKSKTFVAPDGNTLTVDDGFHASTTTLVPPSSIGGSYSLETEKKISGVPVSRELRTFDKISGNYKISTDTLFEDPTMGPGLTTEHHYYPASAANAAGRLWFILKPTGAWEIFEYLGNGETVKYTPFASEAVLDPAHSDPTTLPLIPAPGLFASSARIRKTISSGIGGSSEYVVSLAEATIPGAGVLAHSVNNVGPLLSVANTPSDSIPDGIQLEGRDDSISYSYQIPSDSPHRWLAGLPLLIRNKDGSALYYEYQLNAGIFTETVTTGFSRLAVGEEIPTVGAYRFEVVPHLSERTVKVRGSQGLVRRETLYHTGEGFTSAQVEELFYQNGRYHHTLSDGVEIRHVEWPDPLTRVVKDEVGLITTSRFNSSGELLWVEAGAGGGVSPVRTTFERIGLTTTTRINGVISGITVVDGLGRTVSSQDQAGVVTTYSYPKGGRDRKITLPGDIVKLEENYLDGSLKAHCGTGWVASYHSVEVDPLFPGYQQIGSEGSSSAHSVRKEINYLDPDGKVVTVVKPSPTGADRSIVETHSYKEDILSSVSSAEVNTSDNSVTAQLPSRLYFASSGEIPPAVAFGGETTQGLDIDGDGELTFGTDRFSMQEVTYQLIGGIVYRKTLDHRYPDTTGANPLTTETLESLGFIKVGTSSYSRVRKVTQPSSRSLTVTTLIVPATATVITTDDDSATTATVDTRTTQINGYTQTVETAGGGASQTYSYDTFGRLNRYTDPRNAVTLSYFDGRFLLSSITDQLRQTVNYTYYLPGEKSAGMLKTVTHPGGLVEETAYNDRGQITFVSGSAAYPQLYGYDDYGDQVTLKTYGTETALTRWFYQAATGLLEKKRYDDANKPAGQFDFKYEYAPDGKLAKRTTGKGVITTYGYDETTRDLAHIDYTNDANLTPDVTISDFDGFGRPRQVSEARTGGSGAVGTDSSTGTSNYTTTQALSYDSQSDAISIAYDANHRWLKSIKLQQTTDTLGRSTGFELRTGTTLLSSQTYSYAAATSRLQGVSSPDIAATLALLPGAETLQSITVSRGGNVIHERTLAVDLLGRTVGVSNKAGASAGALATIASIGHKYDAAGRRDDAQREDGTWWDYAYNDRSEVTGAIKKTSGNDPVPGLSFGYDYDAMGNRKTSTSGTGAGVSSRAYGRNALNQYTSLTHDGKVNVLGRADIALTDTSTGVTPNGIDTQGNLYGVRQTSIGYATNGKLVTTTLKRSGSTGDLTPQAVLTWVPPASFVPIYDADGNLTYDGRWNYTWDGENRLVSATTATNAVTGGAPNITVKYAYDWQGRRLGRSVTQSGTTTHQSFGYDGWNPVAEWSRTTLNQTLTLQRTNLWGPDVASRARASFGAQPDYQAAGGVSGLISTTYYSGSNKDHFIPSYDANGNILAWSDGSGILVQRKDYDPFGNAVFVENFADTATFAKLPSFGFSTKMQDAATGLYYYGHRDYDPLMGRWPSRDPIEEKGGTNLYEFVKNNGLSQVDRLGLSKTEYVGCCSVKIFAGHGPPDRVFPEPEDPDSKLPRENLAIEFAKEDHVPARVLGETDDWAAAVIACNSGRYAYVKRPIPGYTPPKREIPLANLDAEINTALSQAESYAQGLVDSDTCKQVTIEVFCFGMSDSPSSTLGYSKSCGTKKRIKK